MSVASDSIISYRAVTAVIQHINIIVVTSKDQMKEIQNS